MFVKNEHTFVTKIIPKLDSQVTAGLFQGMKIEIFTTQH